MLQIDKGHIETEFFKYIQLKQFPCVGAKTANAKNQIKCLVVDNIFCPANDIKILTFLNKFIDEYRLANTIFHSAAIIFSEPTHITEAQFEKAMWQRLQSISTIDAKSYAYDKRVSADINSPLFSFSIKEEALFVVGIHPSSSRLARRFAYPTLIFNPHAQFDVLKQTSKYKSLQHVIRKKDIALSGTINPMLSDYAVNTELKQYSGKNYGNTFICPLKITHASL
jgi:uncharacterized protein